jgi:hypothetical protein
LRVDNPREPEHDKSRNDCTDRETFGHNVLKYGLGWRSGFCLPARAATSQRLATSHPTVICRTLSLVREE